MIDFNAIDRNKLLEIAAVELPDACEKLLSGKGKLTERQRLLSAACLTRGVTIPEAQETSKKGAD
ncbi:MAG: hypothetical protein ACRBBS_17535 [Thalassovita sp.]